MKPRGTSLRRDEHGAILVLGIVMAVLLVGVLYYLEGVGESLFHRERMQDAADAAALSTAIGHARGMNLIVFINLVMAALVAVLLALKVIEMLLSALLVVLAAIAWFVPAAAAQIPVVNSARTTARQTHDAARRVVEPLLVVLRTTERVVAAVIPVAAMTKTALDIQGEYADVVGDVPPPTLPTRLTLPVDDDRYERLCERAEGLLDGLVTRAVGDIPLISKVMSAAMGGIIGAVADYYCKGADAPEAELEFDRTLPQSAAGRRCEDAQLKLSADPSACAEWQRELFERRPEPVRGDCASPRGRCEDNLWQARQACDPRNERLQNFSFANAHVVESLTYTAAGWTTSGYRYSSVELVNYPAFAAPAQGATRAVSEPVLDRRRPCSPAESSRGARGWSAPQTRVRAPNADARDATTVIPVCTLDRREPALDARRAPPPLGTTATIEYQAVKHIYGCTTRVERELEIPEDWRRPTKRGNERRAPQKLEDGLGLGDEAFQIRGFVVFGRGVSARAEAGLDVAAWHRTLAPERWVDVARPLGRFSLAQAEYHYDHDGSEPAAEWLWNMKWRARLVRFSWPKRQRTAPKSTNEYAGLAGAAPFDLDLERIQPTPGASLRDFADLVVH